MPIDVARGLREDLAASIDEVEEAETATPEPLETPGPPVESETPPEKTEATDERPRGPDGKFLPKDKTAEAAPVETALKEPKKPDAPEAAAQPDTKPAKPAADPIATATARWSAADKTMLAKLPPEAQQFLIRRNDEMVADHTRKTMAIENFRKEYEPVDQMFAPFRQQMQSQGFTPSSLIKAWADVEQQLMQGKGVDIVAKIIRDYKVDPAAVAKVLGVQAPAANEQPKPNGAAIQLDPEVQRLLEAHLAPLLAPIQKQVADVTGFTQAQKDQIARQQAADLEQRTRAANETVQKFIDAVGKDGQPLHPYYQDVQSLMVTLAQAERAAGRTPDLEQIYDQAVYATPSTREKLLAANQAAQEATRQAEARAKATAARNAAVSVTGAPTGGPAPRQRKEPASLRETLLEAAAEHEDAA